MKHKTLAFCYSFAGGIIQAVIAILVTVSYVMDHDFIYYFTISWASWGLISPQILVSFGLVFSFFVLAGAILIGVSKDSRRIVVGSTVVIIFSLASLVFNGGGFLIGTFLGVGGGGLAYIIIRPDYSA